MFDILFGWRKASKCKKLVKRVQCRLKLLKNKRSSIAKLVREDVAQLILTGHHETAFNRAEQLVNDQRLVSVYELLDQFCEFILVHLSYIRKHKDIPNDINEAVSSLIFASARCGDLPELRGIRKLFGERYGQRFATAAVELFPGNLVNHQIKEKLSVTPVPDDVKQIMFDEIARENSVKPDILAIEFASEQQKQENENSLNQKPENNLLTYYKEVDAHQIQDSSAKQIMGKPRIVDSVSTDNKLLSRSSQTSRQNSDMTTISVSSSIVHHSSHDMSESPIYDKEEVENGDKLRAPFVVTVVDQVAKQNTNNGWIRTTISREERVHTSSSESFYQFHEDKLIYLDDIEEFESSKTKDGDCQDQRLFLFKPAEASKESSMDRSEKVESRRSRRSMRASGKRQRRKSVSRESQGMDMECFIYRDEPVNQKHITHNHRKQQKKSTVDFQFCECRQNSSNGEMDKCSLEHPCYCCTGDEKDVWEVPSEKQKRIENPNFLQEDLRDNCSHYGSRNGKAETRKLRRQEHSAAVYDVFTYPDPQLKSKSRETKGDTSYWTRKEMVPPYVRAATMPQERPRGGFTGDIQRSNSCPYQQPSHVHPKLPEYDDIAAKFLALKKDHQQNRELETEKEDM